MAVILDHVQGSQAAHRLIEGWAITRMATVTDIVVAPPINIGKLFTAALALVESETGPRGSACPDIDVPTYLEQFIPETISSDCVRVRIIYKGYPLPVYEMSSAVSNKRTNKDADGVPITLAYTYANDYRWGGGVFAGVSIPQGGLVNREMHEPVFTIRFIVLAGELFGEDKTATEIMSYLMTFEGKTNADIYTIGLIEGAIRTWKITTVRGVTRDGGISYEASITYQYRESTWDEVVPYIDPNTGKPPEDVDDSSQPMAIKTIKAAPSVVFPTLSFGGN